MFLLIDYAFVHFEQRDDALKAMGMPPSDAVQIGTMASEEATDVDTRSPVTGFAGYPR